MRYVFFGTPQFAKIVLNGLIGGNTPPIALVCNPDRPIGRKKTVMPPAAKIVALKNNENGGTPVEIFQPEKIDAGFIKQFHLLEPDFFVVAAYAKILPHTILSIPRLGTLGVHPSLLPKFRGASPIQSAILAGEATTGITIYLLDEKTDHGPILIQKQLATENPIYQLSYVDLEEKLALLGAQLLLQIMPDFAAGKIIGQPQDESQATFTKKFTTADAFIEPFDLATAIDGSDAEKSDAIMRKINAFNPEPGAWTFQNGKRIKLFEAELNGTSLRIKKIQEEGQRVRTID
jgi:methionyl-tRNA formyltransferase